MPSLRLLARPRHVLLVSCVAILVRVLAWQELSGSAVLHLERFAASDMALYQRWAQAVAGGDLLLRDGILPDNAALVLAVGEAEVALRGQAHRKSALPPCDEACVSETWRTWLGNGAYWREPLYPYLVGGVYAAWGAPDARVVYVLQSILGVLSCLLAMSVATLLFGHAAGLAAGLLAAVLGTGIHYEVTLLPSALTGFCALACVWTLLHALAAPHRWWWALAAGACAGTAWLASMSAAGFVALALPISLLAMQRRWLAAERARPMPFVAAFVVGVCVAISPLVARNLALDLPPLRSSAATPLDFINGNALGASPRGGPMRSPLAPAILAANGWDLSNVVASTIQTHTSTGEWFTLIGDKLLGFWRWFEQPGHTNYYYFQRHVPLASHLLVGWPVLAALAAVGAVFGMRRSPGMLASLLWVASTSIVCAAFFNSSHLRFPAALALVPLAGHGVALLLDALRQRSIVQLLVRASLAIAVGAASLAPWEVPFGLIRTDLYNAYNNIALGLSDEALARGDVRAALTVAEKQLRAMPEALSDVPKGAELGLDPWMASAAGGFARLYRRTAELQAQIGEPEIADDRRRRAEVLEAVVSEWKFAPRKPPPAAGTDLPD